ncbi:MAG TPA: LptA/OstA family protein, partial [Thermoanaerobaculia bacterium]|nr:LptA/OstA family protein [Thermoanaerobaculia bacterium]
APTPLSLRAQRVALERRERVLRAEGNVRLTHGASSIQARRVAAFFAEDERTLRSVGARWEVSGELVPAGGGAPVRLGGYRLAADLDPTGQDVRQVELEGGEGRPARLMTTARGGERRLRASQISARLESGALRSAVASGGVELQEPAAGQDAVREAEAAQAEAAFGAGGALVAVTLTGDVRLSAPDLRASGHRAYVEQASGRAELFGRPGGVDAVARNERGELRSPHVVYTRSTGVLHADGGVKAQLAAREGSAVAGVPLGAETGPIRVEAKEATWQERPPTFSFAGDVRAWRGDNLLTAEQLRGNETSGELSASGGVRTLWVLGEAEGAAAADADPPIEVIAATLLYRREQRELLYGGGVRVTQEKRVLTCRDARVELDQDQRARRMTCAGQARLDDPAAGRRVTGESADYDLVAKTITVSGDPVTLNDDERGVARGRQLVYDVASGTVRLSAEEKAAPEGPA